MESLEPTPLALIDSATHLSTAWAFLALQLKQESLFVGVPGVFEGKFAVGLEGVIAGPDLAGDVQLEWLKRVGMSYTAGAQGYSWKGSPTFHAW
eukprot:6137399-Pleurochrysis_carterae.AAC.1